MPTNKPRTTVTFQPQMLRAVQDYQYENRRHSLTDAVMSLIEIGLATVKENPTLGTPAPKYSKDAVAMAEAFDNVLDDAGRRFVRNTITHEVSRVTGKPI